MQDNIFNILASLTYWALTLYEWIIIIAILISWVHPDPANPIVQFLNRMTLPLWNRLTQILPGPLRLFSAYISLLLVWFLRILLPGWLTALGGYSTGLIGAGDLPGRFGGYFLLGAGVVAKNLLFFLMVLLLIWFFMTLITPSVNNPIVRTVFFLVDPFITPIQRRLPRQRIDLSPLIAAGIFFLINMLLIDPLVRYAISLSMGGAPMLSSPVY